MARLLVAGALSLVGLGLARLGAWIADIPLVDPTSDALHNLRDVVREIPFSDGVPGGLVSRSGVLAALGDAITEAER